MIFIRTLIPDPLLVSLLLTFTIGFAATLVITPFVRNLAKRFGFYDSPSPRRVNQERIPNIGGVSFILSLFLTMSLAMAINDEVGRIFLPVMPWLVLASIILLLAGLFDDLQGLNFIQKFSVQVAVGGLLVLAGMQIRSIPTLFWGPIELGWLSVPFTILWVSALCNAINLIDGLDGLAAGIVAIAAGFLAILAIIHGDVGGGFLATTIVSVTLAFLYFNFHPAKIFMGDTGSLFLGFILSVLMIHHVEFQHRPESLLSQVIVLGIPLFDMVLTILRRAAHKRHLFRADRLHIHHRLVDMMGMDQKHAVLTLYAWSGAFGTLGVLVSLEGETSVFLGIALCMLLIVGVATKLRYFRP